MSVARSSLKFSLGTFFSRISGVLRESAVGAVFGASAAMDAFNIAFRIPNLLRDLLAEGALGSSFTKVFTQVNEQDPEKARRLFWETLSLLFFCTAIISLFGILFSSNLVALITQYDTGSKAQLFDATVFLTRVMFPYIIFASLGAVTLGVLYQRNKFFLAAVSPIAFNVSSIVGALLFSKLFLLFAPESWRASVGDVGILGLAIGVLLGGFLQFLMQFIPIAKDLSKNLKSMKWFGPVSKDFIKILMLMAPMLIATSAAQINAVVNTNFATQLETGSVSWLNYAFRILQLPVGMFGVAVGAAVLPALVKSLSGTEQDRLHRASKQLVDAVMLVLWLTIPCWILMERAADAIIALLYRAGRFSPHDVEMTASVLRAYGGAVLGYGLIKVFTSFYYAVDRTRYAMAVSVFTIFANYIGNFFLVKRFGVQGLAYTATITLNLNAFLLFCGVFRSGIRIHWKNYGRNIGALLIAAAIAFGVLSFLSDFVSTAFSDLAAATTATGMKLYSIVLLTFLVGALALIFGIFGLGFLKMTPQQAIRAIRHPQRAK